MSDMHKLHVPEKRQSVMPDRAVLLGLVAVGAVLLVVWLTMAYAVGGGGDDCAAQSTGRSQTGERCR